MIRPVPRPVLPSLRSEERVLRSIYPSCEFSPGTWSRHSRAILDRTTNQYVKPGTLQWHLGSEIGSANGLAIGKYKLQYYHVGGFVGMEDFQVTDGGAG